MTPLSRRQNRRRSLVAVSALAGLIVIGLLPTVGSAQSTTPNGQTYMQGAARPGVRGRILAALMAGITLTDQQLNAIDLIRAGYSQQLQQARVNQDVDELQALVLKELGDLRRVLTPDQQVIFDKNVERIRENRANNQAAAR
jgi:hypothetical protein